MHDLFRRLLSRAEPDGQASTLEPATMPPAPVPPDAAGATRRERGLGVPRDLLDHSLSQKVLHGWLQNRHQVLVPLTLRLGHLPAGDADLLMRFVAAAMLAAAGDVSDRGRIETWLRGVGADRAALDTLADAFGAPCPLDAVIDGVRERHLETYAYAATVVAADLRVAAEQLFVDFLAARLKLPPEAVRSINRRFRR